MALVLPAGSVQRSAAMEPALDVAPFSSSGFSANTCELTSAPLTLIARSPLRGDRGGHLDDILAHAIFENGRGELVGGVARVAQELRIHGGNARELVFLAVQRRLERGEVLELAFLETEIDRHAGGIQRREQIFAIAKADLAAVVTEREAVVAAIGELTRHLEEAALPDLHDGEQARIEGVVHAVGISHVDGAPRRARQRAALQAHFIADQPLHGVGERVIGLRGRERGELGHGTAARADH